MFKESKIPFLKTSKILADTGYQGLKKIHENIEIPHKKSKKRPLNKAQKQENRAISKVRVVIENIFANIKKFKIIAERYRNRRKRFCIRFNLISGIHNLEI